MGRPEGTQSSTRNTKVLNVDYRSRPFRNVDRLDLFRLALARAVGPLWWGIKNVWSVYLVLKHVRNVVDVAALLFGGRSEALLQFRDGSTFRCRALTFRKALQRLLAAKEQGYRMQVTEELGPVGLVHANRPVSLEGPDCIGLAYHVFFRGEYASLQVRGRTVVDVGAAIGDTAIYFALNGAARVIAFEPFPYSFEFAVRNIGANNLSDRVSVRNAAVGRADSEIVLGAAPSSGSSQVATAGAGLRIETVSLRQIAALVPGSDGLLKLDCEGSEYEIILESDSATLRQFAEIILEFHYGHANLRDRLLAAGFHVAILKRPTYFFHATWAHPHARLGTMKASRVDPPSTP